MTGERATSTAHRRATGAGSLFPPPAALLSCLLLACLTLVSAGCGSSSGSTSSAGTAGTQAGTGNRGGARSSGGPLTEPTTPAESSPGASVREYGAAARRAREEEVTKAAFSFFRAMAASDYAGLCADLAASNLAQLRAFTKADPQRGGCPATLKDLISDRGVPEARRAAHGDVTGVRVKGDTAFVLFRPKGGVPSYFVMKEEGGAWKAIGLAPGTPIDPTATP